MAAVTIADRLQLDLTYPFEGAYEEGSDSYQIARKAGLDLTFPKLWTEALQQADLFLTQLEFSLSHPGLQTERPCSRVSRSREAPHPSDPATAQLNVR